MTRRKPLAGIYQITTFLALVLLLLILFISAAWFFMIPAPEQPPGEADLLAELATKRSAWETKQPASYRYVVDRDCNCEPTYTEPYVATQDGDNRSAYFTVEIESATGEFIATPPGAMWIDELFDLIEQSVRDEKKVDVEYDKTFGYPTSIVVHPAPAPPDAIFRVEVRDFETLEYR